ncbi:NAD(P)(+) transhydrogenase (Re/Si-specific) subunit alpha, partial [Mesorhizobium sp. CAU 1732]
MGQTVFVPREVDATETRVAASPDTVKRLIAFGLSVVVEAGAGDSSRIPDSDYQAAGATIGKAGDASKADIVLKVRRPIDAELKSYKSGAIVLATMDPYGNDAALGAMARAGISAFSME